MTSQEKGDLMLAEYREAKFRLAVARSDNPTFAGDVSADGRVEGAAASAGFGVQLNDDQATDSSGTVDAPATPAPGSDTLSGLQWDMNQIHAPEARAINGGSSSVTVGDIDTGLDFTHPDLAPNVDFANSASCIGGVPTLRATSSSRSKRRGSCRAVFSIPYSFSSRRASSPASMA